MDKLTVVLSVVLLTFCGSNFASPLNNITGSDDPECSTNDDCNERACIDYKCVDLCLDVCGLNTVCQVVNLSPICSCKPGFTGHPFTGCYAASKPECSTDNQCPLDRKCLNEQCVDPCEEACDINSACRVVNHRHVCACREGFSWDRSKGCLPQSLPDCRTNAQCRNYQACINQKCVDPCLNTCGNNTVCVVTNHYPACACSPGFTGNPFDECKPQCNLIISKKHLANLMKQFKVVDLSRSWEGARKYCMSLNMNLVSITSEEDQNRLVQKINSSGIVGDLWTSGMRFRGVNMWVSSGVLEFPYTNWMDNEPDNDDNCVDLLSSHSYRWGTYYCGSTQKFVCEYYEV